jgi:hypothetical protein
MVLSRCPLCDKGKLRRGRERVVHAGVDLGRFPCQACTDCGEALFDEATGSAIDEAAKGKGVWGLGAETSVGQAGNSLILRIPRRLASHLKIRKGTRVFLTPREGRGLDVEII